MNLFVEFLNLQKSIGDADDVQRLLRLLRHVLEGLRQGAADGIGSLVSTVEPGGGYGRKVSRIDVFTCRYGTSLPVWQIEYGGSRYFEN